MLRNNTININLIAKQYVNIENDIWGKRLFDRLCPPNFSLVNYWKSLDVCNQFTYTLCLSMHYNDSSEIEFYTVMLI